MPHVSENRAGEISARFLFLTCWPIYTSVEIETVVYILGDSNMTKRHTAPRVPAEGPKKLALGLSLSERLDFVKLCERTALPWQIQVGLVTSIAKGEIHSLDKMIRFIEDVLAKDGKK